MNMAHKKASGVTAQAQSFEDSLNYDTTDHLTSALLV